MAIRRLRPPPNLPTPHTRKGQYELLLPYYKEEAERYEALNKRAAAYLSILGAASAFAVVKADTISKLIFSSPILLSLAALTLAFVLLCVLTVSFATRITEYLTPVDPRAYVLEADASKYTEEDSYSVLLAGLVQSIEVNRRQNDKAATGLQWALSFAAIALILFIALNCLSLYAAHKETEMATQSNRGPSAPASSPPSQRPISDLLKPNTGVPVKKGNDLPPPRPPGPVPVK